MNSYTEGKTQEFLSSDKKVAGVVNSAFYVAGDGP